jgi:AbrB family looped-hinge helix DNA binding protein
MILKVRKKGVLILPKRLREEVNIREGDEVAVEVRKGSLIITPFRPKVVDVDPAFVERLLREEIRFEEEGNGRR